MPEAVHGTLHSMSAQLVTHRYQTAAPGAPRKALKSSCGVYKVRLRQSLRPTPQQVTATVSAPGQKVVRDDA